MSIRTELAESAINTDVAAPLGLSPAQAAAGMQRIVNANMAAATRLVSVAKGHDPRDFALLAFGGAGPLHAVAIAEELEIPWVLVPPYPGNTSAAGLVVADIVHNFVQSVVTERARITPEDLSAGFDTLRRRATETLEANAVSAPNRRFDLSLDIKYVGQGYTLEITLEDAPFDANTLSEIDEQFHTRHEAFYGFRADGEPIEIINLRLQATGLLEQTEVPPNPPGTPDPTPALTESRNAWAEDEQAMLPHQVFDRARLATGNVIPGPAIVEQTDSTTLVPAGWIAVVDPYDNLVIGKTAWTDTPTSARNDP